MLAIEPEVLIDSCEPLLAHLGSTALGADSLSQWQRRGK